MTVHRRHGTDSPFGAWIRGRSDLDSVRDGITVNDVDWKIHKYKNNVDGLGRRTVHLMMNVEVKAFDQMPSDTQRQTLFFQHQLLNKRQGLDDAMSDHKRAVWHFGYFVLSMPDERPGPDHTTVKWCSFSDGGVLVPRTITVRALVSVLRFDMRPDTLASLDLRRHHKTSKIVAIEKTALGFECPRIITTRS